MKAESAKSAKPREAAGPPGICQPTAPDGSFWPASEPCLSLGDGPFHLKLAFFPQAQTDSSYFRSPCQEWAHLGLPLCMAFPSEGR